MSLQILRSILVISNSKGISEILRDILTSTYQIFRIEEKLIRLNTFYKYICNWTFKVGDILKILWKRGEIAQLLLRSNFSSFPQFFYLCWIFVFRQGPDFHFEISGYSK